MKLIVGLCALMGASIAPKHGAILFVDRDCLMLGSGFTEGKGPSLMPGQVGNHICQLSGSSMSCTYEHSKDVLSLQSSDGGHVWREADGRAVLSINWRTKNHIWAQTEIVPGTGILHKQCRGIVVVEDR